MQEKTQWEEFVQAMRVNEDLFPSCMAKVDNENKCVKSEELKSIDLGCNCWLKNQEDKHDMKKS